jgi:hypothetical protein
LESKHTFTLSQFFKIAPNLKQYIIAKLAPGIKNITIAGLNAIISLEVTDLRMVVI